MGVFYVQVVEIDAAACPGVVCKGVSGVADDLSVYHCDETPEILFVLYQLFEGDVHLFRRFLEDRELFKQCKDGREVFFGRWSDDGVHGDHIIFLIKNNIRENNTLKISIVVMGI